jgi:peptidoglycan/xylan/chitin deacetylase (PgdA/CDA1 family)
MARIRGLGRLRRYGRRIMSAFQRRGVVLLYHRIAQSRTDAQLLCVSPEHFARQLEFLRCHFQVIGMRELAGRLAVGEIPRDAVVLTFDDGYADNFHAARPLMEQYQVPATFFVASGYIGQGRVFWWDELERILLRSSVLPESLEVTLNGETRQWRLEASARLDASEQARYRHWHIGWKQNPTPRHQAYRDLHQLLCPLATGDREAVLAQLRTLLPAEPEMEADCRAVTPEELCRLGDGELFEVGAHTVTHPVLAGLSQDSQREEMQWSKQALEEIVGRPVTSFSYPYGGDAEVGAAGPRLAQQVGFHLACMAEPGSVGRRTDPFRLPRVIVRDWDGDEFARRLRTFFRTQA